MIRLGLTGGIGSGKSTVAGMLAGLGAAVIDADAISRSTTASQGSAVGAIREQFGDDFITVDGQLDRARMRERIFEDPRSRLRLEAIIHPLVRIETQRQEQSAITNGQRCLVFDIPLLVESAHWRRHVDSVLVIDCTLEEQITRTMNRSGLDRKAVEKIIESQASRLTRLASADIVIFNSGLGLKDLSLQVVQISRHFGL
jgi:dephospho-CoA kinase